MRKAVAVSESGRARLRSPPAEAPEFRPAWHLSSDWTSFRVFLASKFQINYQHSGIFAQVLRLHNTGFYFTDSAANLLLFRYVQTMATNAADPMEQDTEFRTATLQRKRAHDVVSCDDASNAGSAHSTPRKRARHAEKVGHQNVRDFVPAGASFSTGVVPVDEALDGDDDGSQAGISPKAETLGEYEVSNVSESEIAEWEKALVEGRRLIIRNLPLDTTEKDIKQFFRGYPM